MRKLWNFVRVICIIIIYLFIFVCLILLMGAAGLYIKNHEISFYNIIYWGIVGLLIVIGMILFLRNMKDFIKKDSYKTVEAVMYDIKKQSSSDANGNTSYTYYPIWRYYFNGKYERWEGTRPISYKKVLEYRNNKKFMESQKINLLVDDNGYACYEKDIIPNILIGIVLLLVAAALLFIRYKYV